MNRTIKNNFIKKFLKSKNLLLWVCLGLQRRFYIAWLVHRLAGVRIQSNLWSLHCTWLCILHKSKSFIIDTRRTFPCVQQSELLLLLIHLLTTTLDMSLWQIWKDMNRIHIYYPARGGFVQSAYRSEKWYTYTFLYMYSAYNIWSTLDNVSFAGNVALFVHLNA